MFRTILFGPLRSCRASHRTSATVNLRRLALGLFALIVVALPISRATFAGKTLFDECYKRLEADRIKTDEDAARHGKLSKQVRKDQNRFEKDRQWCRDHHVGWDHNRFDVGVYAKPQ